MTSSSAASVPELIEAAARCGETELAAAALRQLGDRARAAGTPFALGIEARSRALLSQAETADALYGEAVERLSTTLMGTALARAHLLRGEWLRRESRRIDAREQLRVAHTMFAQMGMHAFAERASRELLATGEKLRKHSAARVELTAQEEQIARLAADGHTNAEIAAQLFLSRRTIEWHLHKVFAKLGINSRRSLRQALQRAPRTATPA